MKEFKTVEEQVEYLVQTKNIIYSSKIEDILSERTYVSLINTYKDFFYTDKDQENKHTYQYQTDIDNYIKLAAFDDAIGNKLHNYIGYFERKLKMVIAYEYSKFLKNINNDIYCTAYLEKIKTFLSLQPSDQDLLNHDIRIFDEVLNQLGMISLDKKHFDKNFGIYKPMENFIGTMKYRSRLMKSLHDLNILDNNINNNILHHYISNQNTVPFWILVHQLSFGELTTFCGMLNDPLRLSIYKKFNDIDQDKFCRKKDVNTFFRRIDTVRNLRNVVNHYEPLIIRLKHYEHIKVKVALDLLIDNYNRSIIANTLDINLGTIQRTDYNQENLNLYSILKKLLD